jgi:hypothetical protein
VPTNQLAPPVLPGLFMPNIGPPNQMAPDPQAPGAANMPLQVNPMAPMSPADVYNFNAANLGDAWKAAQDPQTWTDAAQAYSQAMLAGSIGPEGKGFTAYHGSPHLFDQFDLSKIGTGEGAQAYGHGMYLADSEGVARSYRDTLSQEQGPTISWIDSAGKKLDMDALQGSNGPQSSAAYMLNQRGSVDEALADVQKYGPGAFAGGKPEMDGVISALQQFKDAGLTKQVNRGHMYEVNVNADPAKFLDWDAPLSEQPVGKRLAQVTPEQFGLVPEQTRRGIEYLTPDRERVFGRSQAPVNSVADLLPGTGRDVYNQFVGAYGGHSEAAQALNDAGIPGIRYLDQGSRNVQVLSPRQTTSGQWITKQVPNGNVLYRGDDEVAARAAGQGTRNSVVFDPATMNIIRRYGLAGLMAGGAAAATQQPSQ